jgi:hypothetical protein
MVAPRQAARPASRWRNSPRGTTCLRMLACRSCWPRPMEPPGVRPEEPNVQDQQHPSCQEKLDNTGAPRGREAEKLCHRRLSGWPWPVVGASGRQELDQSDRILAQRRRTCCACRPRAGRAVSCQHPGRQTLRRGEEFDRLHRRNRKLWG